MGLKASQNPGWDLNPWSFNQNHAPGIWTYEAQVLCVSAQKQFSGDKLIDKKWIYLKRNRVQATSEGQGSEIDFMGWVILQANQRGIIQIL